jgi:HK97 family phage portal protein
LRWLEGRKYGSEEIARMFAIPPAMLGMESNTAYSNYEQQVLQFHQGCVLPWVRRIELEIERKLLKDESLTAKFKVDSLLRADLKTRAEYYHSLLSDGVLSINEVRAKEGFGPVEGGDEHHLQVNQLPLSSMKDYADSITNPPEPVAPAQTPDADEESGEPEPDV